jgi:hypothetical protein
MKTRQVSVRLGAELVRRAQALLPALAIPGRPATITDVYRAIIMRGLEDIEKQGPPSAVRSTPAVRARRPIQ